jgi:hypothetical protein
MDEYKAHEEAPDEPAPAVVEDFKNRIVQEFMQDQKEVNEKPRLVLNDGLCNLQAAI